jgi:hypothetical protein
MMSVFRTTRFVTNFRFTIFPNTMTIHLFKTQKPEKIVYFGMAYYEGRPVQGSEQLQLNMVVLVYVRITKRDVLNKKL